MPGSCTGAAILDTTFLLGVGDADYLVRIHRGRVEAVDKGPFVQPRWTFALRASQEAWDTFWQPLPPPGGHDLIAMIKTGRCGSTATSIPSWPTCATSRTCWRCRARAEAAGGAR